jgi:hypothetical protein
MTYGYEMGQMMRQKNKPRKQKGEERWSHPVVFCESQPRGRQRVGIVPAAFLLLHVLAWLPWQCGAGGGVGHSGGVLGTEGAAAGGGVTCVVARGVPGGARGDVGVVPGVRNNKESSMTRR